MSVVAQSKNPKGMDMFLFGNGDWNVKQVNIVDGKRVLQVAKASRDDKTLLCVTEDHNLYSMTRRKDGDHADGKLEYDYQLMATEIVGVSISCECDVVAAIKRNGDLFTAILENDLDDGNHHLNDLLGRETHDRESLLPVKELAGKNVIQADQGWNHAVALCKNGHVYSWGLNEDGQLGHGIDDDDSTINRPKLIEALKDKKVKQIAARGFHSAALTTNGEVFTFGYDNQGQLGHSNASSPWIPVRVPALGHERIKSVSCGVLQTAFVTENGSLYTCGRNKNGKLGVGDSDDRYFPTLVDALKDVKIEQVSFGTDHAVARTSTGQVYTWGRGDKGRLGYPASEDYVLRPQLVQDLQDLCVLHVEALGESTIALVDPESKGVRVRKNLSASLQSIVNNEQFSDVVFELEGGTVHGHRAILSARCEYFRALFEFGSGEPSSVRESSGKATVTIEGVGKEAFLKVLHFLYTDEASFSIEHAIDVYGAADMYGLPQLKNICLDVLTRDMDCENAALLLEEAKSTPFTELQEICMAFVVENLKTVKKSKGIEGVAHGSLLEIVRRLP